eukprot:scaffold1234_cov190-Alexandrium_tamarense.AAC.23
MNIIISLFPVGPPPRSLSLAVAHPPIDTSNPSSVRPPRPPSMGFPNRSILAVAVLVALSRPIAAGYAPDKAPKLPDGFCPKETETATATTGECMCNWQHKVR